tara:strand:- start:468 stop:995 length:528 start_codon:yes stop_codon:yes gene_type:complete
MKFKVSEVPEVSAGRCQVPGKYAVKIASAQDAVSSNGNDMTKLVLSVAKGGRKGEVMYTQVMIPNTPDEDLNKIHARTWARFLMSTGLTSKQATSLLMKGFDTDKLNGKTCFVEFSHQERDGRMWDRIKWLTPAQAEVHMAVAVEAPVEEPEDDGPNPMDEFLGGDDDDDDIIPF